MATIKIIHGDINTGDLWLSDCGYTRERKGNHIEWKIANPNGSNVASIERVIETSVATIFEKPPTKNGNKWKAKIRDNASDNAECKYSIFWKAKSGTQTYEYDPKISVMPSFSPFAKLLFGIIPIIGACLTFRFLQKKIIR